MVLVFEELTELVKKIGDFVWGPYLLIPLLLLTGVFLTVRLRGIQFTKLWHALWLGLIVRREYDPAYAAAWAGVVW